MYQLAPRVSLISIRKNTEGIIIPSEETRIDMFPMDYEKFRWDLGDKATVPSELSKNASRYQVSSVLSDSERKNLLEVLRQ